MKNTGAVFLGVLHVVGCSVGQPPSDEVAAIERIVARNACVGSLNDWHRTYTFQKRGIEINRGVISVIYTQAGHRGLPAGRIISEPSRDTLIDHAQHRFAFGEYDRATKRFTEWDCGCNLPPVTVSLEIECTGRDG